MNAVGVHNMSEKLAALLGITWVSGVEGNRCASGLLDHATAFSLVPEDQEIQKRAGRPS